MLHGGGGGTTDARAPRPKRSHKGSKDAFSQLGLFFLSPSFLQKKTKQISNKTKEQNKQKNTTNQATNSLGECSISVNE